MTAERKDQTIRTRLLIEEVPSDIFKPEIVEEIRNRGEEVVSAYATLGDFGLGVDESKTVALMALKYALLNYDNTIFVNLEQNLGFRGRDIDSFIRAVSGVRFILLPALTSPSEAVKHKILRNPASAIAASRTRQTNRDWKK